MRKDSKVTLHPRAASAGCSYFGVRIVRHVRRDLAGLAARGYSGVLHTFSENDFAYYRGTMQEIVEASHDVGLIADDQNPRDALVAHSAFQPPRDHLDDHRPAAGPALSANEGIHLPPPGPSAVAS